MNDDTTAPVRRLRHWKAALDFCAAGRAGTFFEECRQGTRDKRTLFVASLESIVQGLVRNASQIGSGGSREVVVVGSSLASPFGNEDWSPRAKKHCSDSLEDIVRPCREVRG